jgi:biotin carboxyl carrier protein
MTFEIDIDGRARSVTVERAHEGHYRYCVTIDGVSYRVDAVQPSDDRWSVILDDSGRSHDVALSRGANPGELHVSIRGHTVTAVVNGRRARRSGDFPGGTGAQRITAPMPGKVLRVLVRPGDEVTARQPLMVVEAMKMENELLSTRSGRVVHVAVAEQALVEAGQLLVVVEA